MNKLNYYRYGSFSGYKMNRSRYDYRSMKNVCNFFISISYVLMPKFCVHCEHFVLKKGGPIEHGRCNLFPEVKPDYYLITGEKKDTDVTYHYCVTARKLDHMCGERGEKFAPIIMDEDL